MADTTMSEPASGHAVPGSPSGEESSAPLRGRLVSGTSWALAGRLLTIFLVLASQALAARLLDPRDFGAYALAISVIGAIALIAQLGMPQAAVRGVASGLARGDEAHVRSLIRAMLLLASGSAVVAAGVVVSPVGIATIEPLFPVSFAAVALLVGVSAALKVFDNLLPEIFRGFHDIKRATLFGGVFTTGALVVALGVVYLLADRISLSTALALTALASAAPLVPALLHLRRRVHHLEKGAGRRRLSIGFDAAFWASSMLTYVLSQIDLWLVNALGQPADSARYAAAFRLVLLVVIPLIVVNLVVPPLIAEFATKGRTAELEKTLQVMATIAGLPALVVLLVFTLAGSTVCAVVYGGFYSSAGTFLAILSVGKMVSVWTGSCGMVLLMTGHQRVVLLVQGMTLAVTIGLSLALFPVWDVEGVAAAMSIAAGLQQVALWLLARRMAGVWTHMALRRTTRVLLAEREYVRSLLLRARRGSA